MSDTDATSPQPDVTLSDLVTALRALPPREERLLCRRLLEGASLETCARGLGISPLACAVHQRRALQGLQELLRGTRPRPRAEETAREEAFASLLDARLAEGHATGSAPAPHRHGPESPPAPAGASDDDRALLTLARALRGRRERLVQALAEAERAEAQAPQSRRNEVLRLLAIAALIALALWFGLR